MPIYDRASGKEYVSYVLSKSKLYFDAAWDIATASYDGSFSYHVPVSPMHGMYFKQDGTMLYLLSSDSVHQLYLSAPWDLSTLSYENESFDVSDQTTFAQGVYFKSDGTKMYIVASDSPESVYQYSLSTPWDITTASYDNVSYDLSAIGLTLPYGISFSTDGTKMYIAHKTKIWQFNLSTPWDISTVSSYTDSGTLPRLGSPSTGVAFSTDGTKMFVSDDANDKVHQYNLSTAWDVTTASYYMSYYVGIETEGLTKDVTLKPDGTKMYIIGNKIYQYSLAHTPVDVSVLNKGNESSVTVTETSETLKQTVSPDYDFIEYLEGVHVVANNPSGSGCTLTFRIKAQTVEGVVTISTQTVNEGESFDSWLRWSVDAIINNSKIKEIRLYAYCSAAPASGYEPTVQLERVTGVQVKKLTQIAEIE